jgi:hypothetical protein
MIGIDQRGIAEKISRLIPDYMAMGERGMGEMTDMEMPLPDNTLPMMTGQGPFGSVAMGGMFTVLKVRREQKPGDYSDPGWYRHPAGTQAWEWKGNLPDAVTSDSAGGQSMPSEQTPVEGNLKARKPSGHEGHH